MLAFGLGSMTGPLLGGWLHDLTGSYRYVPLGYIVGVASAAVLLSLVKKYPERENKDNDE